MSIPQDITQEHLLQALVYIQNHGVQRLDDRFIVIFVESNYYNKFR